MLKIDNISASYGKVKVLHDLSLNIEKGELVCLLGSNGAGKSTTIKSVLGIVKPDTGRIVFEGNDISRKKTYEIIRSGVSIVPEGRRLFPKMSVEQNLLIGIYNEDLEEESIGSMKERIYTLFPRLRERYTQDAGTLSGGEQAMLAIGRAMMQQPSLLILDEPSFGLAPILVEEFYETIKEIGSQGTTIFLSEQNAGKALEVSNRGYVLQKGQIIIEGSRDELMKSDVVKKAYLGE